MPECPNSGYKNGGDLTEAECTAILPEFSRLAVAALKPCPTTQPQPTNGRASDPLGPNASAAPGSASFRAVCDDDQRAEFVFVLVTPTGVVLLDGARSMFHSMRDTVCIGSMSCGKRHA